MKRLVLALALAVAPSAALAQHSHDGPNGGVVVDASGAPYHVEFVARGTELALFILDDNNRPAPVTGASGRAVVQEGGKTATIPLDFAEPNRLVGRLAAPLGKGARVVLSGKLADGRSIQARFVR